MKMKFTLSSSALLKQLTLLQGVIANTVALPILESFLFEINKKQLKISASDIETTINTLMEVESVDTGKIAIPARLLLEILKTFPDQAISFNVSDKLSIEITSEYGKYKLTGRDGEDFPQIPEMKNTVSLDISSNVLSNAINTTLFAVGTDELRPVMTGVLFEINPNGITFVSTDAHKLVKYHNADVKSKNNSSYIVPKKPLSLLKGVLGEGKVKLECNTVNVSFKYNNIVIVTKLIDGKYPNYDAVIPKDHPYKLIVPRQDLLNSLKRVSVFANKSSHTVKFSLKDNNINILAEDLDYSNEANENIKCDYKGEAMEIGFNAKFLGELLGAINTEEILIELKEQNKPGVIIPYKSEENVLMLVMPVMLNN